MSAAGFKALHGLPCDAASTARGHAEYTYRAPHGQVRPTSLLWQNRGGYCELSSAHARSTSSRPFVVYPVQAGGWSLVIAAKAASAASIPDFIAV